MIRKVLKGPERMTQSNFNTFFESNTIDYQKSNLSFNRTAKIIQTYLQILNSSHFITINTLLFLDQEDEEEVEEDEENLYTHLEETYRVLNGAYQIITGAQTETTTVQTQQTQQKQQPVGLAAHVSTIPTTMPHTEEPLNLLKLPRSRPVSRQSRQGSRPSSRRSIKKGEDGNEEEEWEEDDEGDWEWEYYYEDENGEKQGSEPTIMPFGEKEGSAPTLPRDDLLIDQIKK